MASPLTPNAYSGASILPRAWDEGKAPVLRWTSHKLSRWELLGEDRYMLICTIAVCMAAYVSFANFIMQALR